MGNVNNCAISIITDRPNNVYLSGEVVTGTVFVNVFVSRLKAAAIHLMLTGEIGYFHRRTVSDSEDETTTENEHCYLPVYSATTVLALPQPDQTSLTLNQGQHSWPFQILLTDSLPPSLNQPHEYPHVRYYLKIVVNKHWHKTSMKVKQYLTVFPSINLLQNPQFLAPTTFTNQNPMDIVLRGTLNKLGYLPGESMHMTLDIENPKRRLIHQIDFTLLQVWQITQHIHRRSIFQITLPAIMRRADERINKTFVIALAAVPLPPTSSFQSELQQHLSVRVHYVIKLSVKVVGFLADFDIDVPITIGTQLSPVQNQLQGSNPTMIPYSVHPKQSSFRDDDDAPPSYESAIQTR